MDTVDDKRFSLGRYINGTVNDQKLYKTLMSPFKSSLFNTEFPCFSFWNEELHAFNKLKNLLFVKNLVLSYFKANYKHLLILLTYSS